MSAILAVTPPRGLITSLFASDRDTEGHPSLPPGGRAEADAWLKRALVDFAALEKHLEIIQELYGAPIRLPRPRRDQWDDAPPVPKLSPVYRHADPLPDDRVTAVADSGPGVLADAEIAAAMLNPIALFDLYDVIDELIPEHWTAAMHAAAAPVGPRPVSSERDRQPSRRRVLKYAALAAALLGGVGIGALAFRGRGGTDVATIFREDQGTRGKVPSFRARIAAGFDGYASLVLPGADGHLLVLPGPGGAAITVRAGAARSDELPPQASVAPWMVVVVTELRAEAEIRTALEAAGAPGPDRADAVAAYLAQKVARAGVGRVAVGASAFDTPRNPGGMP